MAPCGCAFLIRKVNFSAQLLSCSDLVLNCFLCSNICYDLLYLMAIIRKCILLCFSAIKVLFFTFVIRKVRKVTFLLTVLLSGAENKSRMHWTWLLSGASAGSLNFCCSVLGPLLFVIYVNDFHLKEKSKILLNKKSIIS